jgi:hypothetical protein
VLLKYGGDVRRNDLEKGFGGGPQVEEKKGTEELHSNRRCGSKKCGKLRNRFLKKGIESTRNAMQNGKEAIGNKRPNGDGIGEVDERVALRIAEAQYLIDAGEAPGGRADLGFVLAGVFSRRQRFKKLSDIFNEISVE